MSRKDHKHSRKKLRSDIAAYLSEENEFEWNPHSTDDISVAKELVSMHNQKNKNNEQPEHKYQDYILKNVDLHEVDCSALFFNDDQTCSTASLSTDDESVGTTAFESNSQQHNPNDFESVQSKSDLTGNAPIQSDTEYDTDEGSVSSHVDCHEIDDTDFDMFYQVPVPKNGTPRDLSLTPISIAVLDTVGLVRSRKLLKVLFDSGSTATMIKKDVVPAKAVPKSLSGGKTVRTIAGKMDASQMIHLRDVRLPEFDKNLKISMQRL